MFYFLLIISSIILGYLFGSLSWSIIIGKLFYKKDPREHESGNAGATNSSRLYGRKVASIVLLLDILKTVIPTITIWLIVKYELIDYIPIVSGNFNPLSLIYVCPLFSIIGHCYPLFFKFKGGKGAACYGAFLFIVSPWIALLALICLIALIKKTKMMSFSVLIVAIFVPFLIFIPGLSYLYILDSDIFDILFIDFNPYLSVILLFFILFISTIIIIFKHRENIKRIKNNEERKISLH